MSKPSCVRRESTSEGETMKVKGRRPGERFTGGTRKERGEEAELEEERRG